MNTHPLDRPPASDTAPGRGSDTSRPSIRSRGQLTHPSGVALETVAGPSTHNNRSTRPRGILLRVILAVVVIDLGVKTAVAALIPAGQSMGPLTSTSNPRFLLGLAGTRPAAMIALMVLGIVAGTVVATRLLERGRIPALAAGLALGGAVANTIDRALHGAVTDFLIIGHFVVNLADLAVVLGLITTAAALAHSTGSARRGPVRSVLPGTPQAGPGQRAKQVKS